MIKMTTEFLIWISSQAAEYKVDTYKLAYCAKDCCKILSNR